MLKFNVFLIAVIVLLTGCEIRKKDSSTGLFSRSTSQDTSSTTVFSISRSRSDSTAITGTRSNTEATTTVEASVASSSLYEIVTPMGTMRVRLYDETPQHRDNFKKLVAEGFYNGTTFHRVIKNFMIQGGDPNSTDNDPYNDGTGGPGYTTPAEFSPNLYHKKGALAAARQGDQVNPQRRSSGSQFYIVQGRPFSNDELIQIERTIAAQAKLPNFTFSPEARQTYSTVGGTPFLDMQYTVFGEIIDGFDVLDRIASATTETNDRPVDNISMTIRPVLVQ